MLTRTAAGDQPHLLIVDDEPALGAMIAAVAQKLGYRCTLVGDTAHCLTAMDQAISLVLLDLLLPETDGIELLRVLGQRGYAGGVVLMSGVDKRVLATAAALAHALGLQVRGTLQKPFELQTLTAVLQHHMADHTARRGPPRACQGVAIQELARAIAEDQFILHYQPQLDVASGAVVGLEALVRWQHPARGLLAPEVFIGLAESWGLIEALGRLVLQRGLREFGAVRPHLRPLTLSLNVSAHALDDLALPDTLLALAQQYDVAPAQIIVEITESGLVRDLTTALDILTRLRMKGFQLSLDDFGTGYAMMQQLCRVPATEIKIDRPFVHAALTDDRAQLIVQKTIELGHGLGMRVVGEGVETAQHLALLKAYACDVAQGYLFSRPLAMPDLLAWLGRSGGRRTEAWAHLLPDDSRVS
jgi:EAL domain-containing protein (putative c-di-GMP-specific phosphodiesterase class I)/CheY-like chemotaxis protein